MLVGFHVEGHDHLILKALLATLLAVPEDTIEVDRIEANGMGWQQVLEMLPKALGRFYGKGCTIAVVGVDNDGNDDLHATGKLEDPDRPRHWLHTPPFTGCRQCDIESVVARTRPALHWLPTNPGTTWPIVVSVPVEMVESWVLIARAVAGVVGGSFHAERERRADQKQRVYGRPEATREDVGTTAVPLLRKLAPEQLAQVAKHSRSFADFAHQVAAAKGHL
jgi:hypothetical protein